jgi:hypothetical protein
MENIKNHISILGHRVRDRVTGAEGVVTSVTFDLYGCVQAIVNGGLDKDGKPKETFWYDIARLEIIGDRVMPLPDFINNAETIAAGRKGPEEKPTPHPGRLPRGG